MSWSNLLWFSVAAALACGAAWNAKHGYFYWAAYLALTAIDALLNQEKTS